MKVLVKILPKPEVLDSAGRATFNALKSDFSDLKSCHLGKLVMLEFSDDTDEQKALNEAKKMSDKLLVNPLVETYELEVQK